MPSKRRLPFKSASDYSPHRGAASPSDLPKILGQELREHYELSHDLPHGMFTLLMELNRSKSLALRTPANKKSCKKPKAIWGTPAPLPDGRNATAPRPQRAPTVRLKAAGTPHPS